MKNKVVPSPQTQDDAMKIAKATQKPGQTKEQTKLIAQGIEKGIALYKKQQKEKARQADKARKKVQKNKQAELREQEMEIEDLAQDVSEPRSSSALPWTLLAISWIGFAIYLFQFA